MKGSVDMKRFDLIIVGAGPSGLSAAIEAAKRGLEVVVFDENEKPGGQLFKQIHKFFGSKEHKATGKPRAGDVLRQPRRAVQTPRAARRTRPLHSHPAAALQRRCV